MTGSYLAACFILKKKKKPDFQKVLILGFLHLACMAEIFTLLLKELGSNAKCLKNECFFSWFHDFPAQANDY